MLPDNTSGSGAAEIVHIAGGTGSARRLGREIVVSKLDGRITGGEISLAEVMLAPGGNESLHRHMQHETLYILEGSLEIFSLEAEQVVTTMARQGSVIHIPGCQPHGFANSGDSEAKLLMFHAPAGVERYYEAAGSGMKTGQTSGEAHDQLLVAALQSGVEPVDPASYDPREGYRNSRLLIATAESRQWLRVSSELVALRARGAQTETGITAFDLLQQAGGMVPLHRHPQAKVVYVLEGQMEVSPGPAGGGPLTAGAGSTLYLRRSAAYAFRNAGPAPLRCVFFVVPSGLEEFFSDAGDPVTDSEDWLSLPAAQLTEAQQARIAEAAAVNGIEILSE